MKSIESGFMSHGDRCAFTLMLPDANARPPVIVMAHGFGAIRHAALAPFSERFVAAGYAVFMFDYRGFGDSDGEPRQWVSPRRHLQDWQCAIAHVRSLPEVDAKRLALWGTSFSGGHVLQTAADDAQVQAVIAQIPHVSGLASVSQAPLLSSLPLAVAGVRDIIGGWLGHPCYRPIVGRPGERAAISTPGAYDGFMAMIPPGARWENKTRARIFLELPFYSPIRHARRIQAPTLIIAGRTDKVTPAHAARAAAKRIPKGRFELLDSNHFQFHEGPVFEQSIALQLGFLRETLPVLRHM